MLSASTAYKNSIKNPIRNRGHIKVTIGVVSMDAQASATVDEDNPNYPVISYSNPTSPFNSLAIDGEYATAEPTFSAIDGTRYFAPEAGTTYIRNNGALSQNVLGGIYIQLTTSQEGYSLAGLSIDFGPVYPTSFRIKTDNETYTVSNNIRYYESDLSFVGATFMIITPLEMVDNSRNRLRIYSLKFGRALTFGNSDVISFSSKEYVSPIADTLPSYDMTLVVNNLGGRFDVDDDYNVMSFMSIGQEVTIQHGYDIDGNGTIEWLDPYVSYLATWDANDREATFTSYDKFAIEKNKFVLSGDTLFDGTHQMDECAIAIASQAFGGTVDFSSPKLDDYVCRNPLPYNTYPELLQMVANSTQSILRMKANGVLGILDSGDTTNYKIELSDIRNNIIAKKTAKIQSVNVSYVLYTKNTSAEVASVQTEDITVSASDGYSGIFSFDDCYSDWSVSCDDAGVVVSILDSNPRYVSVAAIRTSGVDGTVVKLSISGRKYSKVASSVSVSLNDNGEIVNWDNPLISNATIANHVANWLVDYYSSPIDYDVDWRGDPRVEAGDVVTLERKGKSDATIRIYQNEFSFNGAWSGRILARRLSDG